MTRSPANRTRRATALAGLAVGVLGLAVVACGGVTPSRSPAASASPGSASSASPDGSGGPRPRTTPWPGNTVIGIESLGVSDGEIRQAINDFGQGVQTSDLALMRRAADGLAGVGILVDSADDIAGNPAMRPLADGLREVLPRIADSAAQLRDAIDAGDAPTIERASRDLAAALTDYAELQPDLAGWVVQVPEQKRILVQ